MKRYSNKRANIEREYKLAQQEIAYERGFQCNNCRTKTNLSFSHLIPRSRRSDLIAEKENIVIHCISIGDEKGCHQRWEERDTTMKDYKDNMKKVKKLDESYYNLIVLKHG